MTNIKVIVNGASVRATADGEITSGMVGIPVSIEYDQTWKNLVKFVSFRAGNIHRTRNYVSSNTTVPWEVLRKHGPTLKIGVEGRNEDGSVVIPTCWASVDTIREGATKSIPAAPDLPDKAPSGEVPAVLYIPQTLDAERKSQARANIGAADGAVLDNVLDALPDGMREQTTIEVVYDAELTQGSIDYNGIETENTERIRTNFIPVGNGIVGTLPEGSTRRFAVRVYSALKEYLGYASHDATGFIVSNAWGTGSPVVVDNVVKYYPTAGYVRFYYDTGDIDAVGMVFTYQSVEVGGLNGTTLDEVYGRTPKQPYRDGNIQFYYTIDEEGHYSKGFIKLPSNYSPVGKPVPLIVFMPASNTFTSINSTMVTESYEKNYNYLRDCGYAIASFYGWGNVYSAGAGVWGTPTNNKCHIKGIQYVCEQYNVDPENIFVTTKSLGGIQALSLCYQNEVKVKACGLLAPELDTLVPYPLGYSKANREAIAMDFGFTGDWQSVLGVENDVYNHNEVIAYLQTQMDKLANIPILKSVLLPLETKFGFRFSGNYDDTALRLCNVPMKIWIAPDDASVSYTKSAWVVKTLQNAGCDAELRTMPEGTGGHQAVDRSENALQTTDVTTRLGIHYDTIPTAYYELEQYFARFAFYPCARND